MEKRPDGVWFEPTADGFYLRASCRSLVDAVLRMGLAAAVSSLPFVLWWDLIRDVWADQGVSFWATCAFLGTWAAAILYAWELALMSLLGEVRITKSGDRGEIFTGIGRLGWTHGLHWSEWHSVSEIVVYADAGRRKGKNRYVVLEAPSKRYRFGSLVPADRQAFIVEMLREHVFTA